MGITISIPPIKMPRTLQYDLRQQRITRSVYLTSKKEELPKSQWTKLENDTFYLGTIIDEIKNEKLERAHTSGLKPGYELKPQL
jgi:hypothetical protein